jgi:acylphosphatase
MRRRGHFVIAGRVQGVGYRMYAREEADRLELTGWVRNCPDGTVEIEAEGEEEALEEFLRWCRRGPSHAYVTRISETYSDPTDEFDSFRIVH